jgi:GT2 family glycosyltransferase
MLKIVILFFKLCIKLVPRKLVISFKNAFPYITSLYSVGIRRAGIAQVFPNQKINQLAYEQRMIGFGKEFSLISERDCFAVTFVILVPNSDMDDLKVSLMSLSNKASVLIVCLLQDMPSVENVIQEFAQLTVTFHNPSADCLVCNQSAFVFYAGQSVHHDISKVLYSYSQGEDDMLYVDSDIITDGKRHDPMFLPQWNPDLQLSTAYIDTGVWFRHASLIKSKITNYNESLALWVAEIYLQEQQPKISRIPYVLLHRPNHKRFSFSHYVKCLNALCPNKVTFTELKGKRTVVAKWHIKQSPLVSLIIPTKNAHQLVKTCIESILKSSYQDFEILLVNNQSDEEESIEYFKVLNDHDKITVLDYPYSFNYSAINNFAVKYANGKIIGLVNNDIEVITSDWLDYMVSHATRDDIGCVGAKLIYPDERIQHAGVVLGYGGGAGHAHKYFPRYHPGYLKRLSASNNYSAVTAACLLVKKTDYIKVGGLNEQDLTVAFNDVDFCLRVLELGRRNLYCAEAELYHHESVSRGLEDTYVKQERFAKELAFLKASWQNYIDDDPAYNPNLTIRRENFSIRAANEITD